MSEALLDLLDYERRAESALDRMAWDYYRSGADAEHTLDRNRAALQELSLYYKVMVDVAKRDLRTTVLGQPLQLPMLIAPTAFHRLAHPEGELATARAAQRLGTTMVLSTLSNTSVEAVVQAAGSAPVWFQLYVYRDREATRGLVERVEAAGCSALVLTVDAPLLGTRQRDVRNGFALPQGLGVENMLPAGMSALPQRAGESGLSAYFADLLDPSLSWRDLEWLRSITKLPVLVKGVVRADDAHRAVEHGATGLVVSNHGGRQLDGAPATIEALGPVVDAVAGAAEVLVDGGFRRGTDVVKALALGAKAVLLGRPVLWGLAVAGEQGVHDVLSILRSELDLAMALCGCPSIDHIGRDLLGLETDSG